MSALSERLSDAQVDSLARVLRAMHEDRARQLAERQQESAAHKDEPHSRKAS